jgi:hypothetical protein
LRIGEFAICSITGGRDVQGWASAEIAPVARARREVHELICEPTEPTEGPEQYADNLVNGTDATKLVKYADGINNYGGMLECGVGLPDPVWAVEVADCSTASVLLFAARIGTLVGATIDTRTRDPTIRVAAKPMGRGTSRAISCVGGQCGTPAVHRCSSADLLPLDKM